MTSDWVDATAVIKARNESSNIEAAIASARLLVDRVLVIDDHSTDATAELARGCGAEVVSGGAHDGQIDRLDRQGFELVPSGWILRMDADERMTQPLAAELRRVAGTNRVAGVRYARRTWFFGAPLRHGGWQLPQHLGFFRADSWDRQWDCGLHSQVPVVGAVETLAPAYASEHHDYRRIDEFVQRSLVGYASVEAREMNAAGRRFQVRDLLLRPWVRFFGRLVLRGGWRDGPRGVVVASCLAAYDIARYSRLWELQKDATSNGNEVHG